MEGCSDGSWAETIQEHYPYLAAVQAIKAHMLEVIQNSIQDSLTDYQKVTRFCSNRIIFFGKN